MAKRNVRICHSSEIDELGARTVRLGDMEIAVFKLTNGEILAVENRCPHKAGKLSEGMVCGRFVHCPLHDWKIDLGSGDVQAPEEGSVRTFRISVSEHTQDVHVIAEDADFLPATRRDGPIFGSAGMQEG